MLESSVGANVAALQRILDEPPRLREMSGRKDYEDRLENVYHLYLGHNPMDSAELRLAVMIIHSCTRLIIPSVGFNSTNWRTGD